MLGAIQVLTHLNNIPVFSAKIGSERKGNTTKVTQLVGSWAGIPAKSLQLPPSPAVLMSLLDIGAAFPCYKTGFSATKNGVKAFS